MDMPCLRSVMKPFIVLYLRRLFQLGLLIYMLMLFLNPLQGKRLNI